MTNIIVLKVTKFREDRRNRFLRYLAKTLGGGGALTTLWRVVDKSIEFLLAWQQRQVFVALLTEAQLNWFLA